MGRFGGLEVSFSFEKKKVVKWFVRFSFSNMIPNLLKCLIVAVLLFCVGFCGLAGFSV